jgi:hypothetical protein
MFHVELFWGIWDAEKENLILPAGKKRDLPTLAFHPKAQFKKMYGRQVFWLVSLHLPVPPGGTVVSFCKDRLVSRSRNLQLRG